MAIIETIALRDTDYNTLYTTGSATIHTSGGETVPLTYNPTSTMYYTDKIKSEQVDDSNSTKKFYRTPTLLWTNSNPTSNMSNGPITVDDMSSYDYIIVVYKRTASTGGMYIKKYKKIIGEDVYINEYTDTSYWRNLNFDSNVRITFDGGHIGSSVDNSAIIPIYIYGTNQL